MAIDKNQIEKTKEKLREQYNKHLDEIFAPETFDLTFDEREKLIYGKFKDESFQVLEDHIDKDPESSSRTPADSCLCPCGLEALLCRDEKGNPKVFEREVKTKNGPVTIKEYGYYCSKDRKIFFPSVKN